MVAFIPDLLDKSDLGSNLLVVELFVIILSILFYFVLLDFIKKRNLDHAAHS